jgi:hypothetical protein
MGRYPNAKVPSYKSKNNEEVRMASRIEVIEVIGV